jgi:hypothetical protein
MSFNANMNRKYDERFDYKISSPKLKGRCLIFNHSEFGTSDMKNRTGTDEDAIALKNLFKNVGLTVRQHDNRLSQEIDSILRKG